MILKPEVERNFMQTFGKGFDRGHLEKLVAKRLKTLEDEYYDNLISHLSSQQLNELKEELRPNAKNKRANTNRRRSA